MTAGVLIKQIRDTFDRLRDVRKGVNNQVYTVADAALSAFAVFFAQSPSFLDYQVRMQKERGRNNATSLFGVHEIPCDQQIRNLLDAVLPENLAPLLMNIVDGIYRLGALETHRTLAGGFTVALDGTEYFASNAIFCPNCSTRMLANGAARRGISMWPSPRSWSPPRVRRSAGWSHQTGLRTGRERALVTAVGAAARDVGPNHLLGR